MIAAALLVHSVIASHGYKAAVVSQSDCAGCGLDE